MVSNKNRDRWSSKIGFILATSGAAVGLGNIQKFPYITSQWGGGAFVLVYLLCVIIIGLPLILVEFSLGRFTRLNPKHAIESLCPHGVWKYFGLLSILTSFFILTYYIVISGWTFAYSLQMLSGKTLPIKSFAQSAMFCIPASAIILLTSMVIVSRGLKSGIERASKIFMPTLVLLLAALSVYTLNLKGANEGLKYFLWPDFSKINFEAFMFALSQAFFSLCVGEAVLVTYGSYADKKDNLISSAVGIAVFDTLNAILAGLVIFPAIFALNEPIEKDIGLIFDVMPKVFLQIPFGNILGFVFFVILCFAALTTCIALLEIPTNYLMKEMKINRKRAVQLVGTCAFILSIPSTLSKGANDFLSNIEIPSLKLYGFYDLMDFIWGSLAMVIGGLGITIFVSWVWGYKNAAKELEKGFKGFRRYGKIWGLHVKYVVPALILCILLRLIFG